MTIQLYTDGSCSKNGSKENFGGYAVILTINNKSVKIYKESKSNTTNNEMELTAIVVALKEYGVNQDEFQYPVVYTDSNYAYKTLTEWYQSWKRNGWKRPKNQPVANLELIQDYDALWENGKRIELRWVRGHNGNKYNEIADKLATGKLTPEAVIHGGGKIKEETFEK